MHLLWSRVHCDAMKRQPFGTSSTDTQSPHAGKPLYPAGTKADADAEEKNKHNSGRPLIWPEVKARGSRKEGDCLLGVLESHMWMWDAIYSTTIEYMKRLLDQTSIRWL